MSEIEPLVSTRGGHLPAYSITSSARARIDGGTGRPSALEDESRPMTLGQALAAQVRLIVWCKGCWHRAEPDVAGQVARCGADTAVIDWARRLRCSACEGDEVDFVVSGAVR